MKENFWMPGLHRKHFVLDTGCLFLCPMQTRPDRGAPSAPELLIIGIAVATFVGSLIKAWAGVYKVRKNGQQQDTCNLSCNITDNFSLETLAILRVFPPTSNLSCSKSGSVLTGLSVAGKTRNVAFQLVLEQCCKTSWKFLLPVYRNFSFRSIFCCLTLQIRGWFYP